MLRHFTFVVAAHHHPTLPSPLNAGKSAFATKVRYATERNLEKPPHTTIDTPIQRNNASHMDNYAPSLPNSCVHSEFRLRSSLLTVGREALMALMKSFTRRGGSAS